MFSVLSTVAVAQMPKPTDERRTVTMILDHTVSNLESEFVPAADAMPEDKFSFAPTNGEFKGVRTYAQQIKHVAAVNYELGAAIIEEKPPVELNGEAGPASVASRSGLKKVELRPPQGRHNRRPLRVSIVQCVFCCAVLAVRDRSRRFPA